MESIQQSQPSTITLRASPNIYQRIAAACQSISTIVKTGQIETKGRTYTVATQSDVLSPVRDAINQNGLSFISKIKSWSLDTKKIVNQYGKEQDQFQLTLIMEYCLINKDNPEERIPVEWPIVCSDDSGEIHKLFGKALTYALKYYFIQTFMLPRDDDDPDLGDKDSQGDKDSRKKSKPNNPSPTNGNGNSVQAAYPANGNQQPQPPVNGNGNKPPNNVALRNECVELLKMFTLGAELEKEFFASFKSGATMLSQIPDDLIPRVHKLLSYASESKDHVETIKDHIARVKIYEDIRVKKDSIIKSGKMTQEQMDVLIVEYTKGTPSTALSNEALKQVVDALDKKSKELGIVDENGKKK